jgi:hypothetical protein
LGPFLWTQGSGAGRATFQAAQPTEGHGIRVLWLGWGSLFGFADGFEENAVRKLVRVARAGVL